MQTEETEATGRAASRRTGTSGWAQVHVVTVTHNSSSTLAEFLEGVERNADAIAALTLVDNASTDATLEVAEAYRSPSGLGVEVIRNANTGFAGGYLAAAGAGARADLPVLCLNPHVVLAEGVIEAMLDVLNTFDDAAVVTAPLTELSGEPDSASRRRLPTFGGSAVYSVLGRFTPSRLRYNAQDRHPGAARGAARSGTETTALEATTGALMLVDPRFRSLGQGIFDTDYWMYGEDLQLCADARSAGRSVLMAETTPSVHVKGVSSGRPRSTRSNRAFHHAMVVYAGKNLIRSHPWIDLLKLAVLAHFALSEARAVPARIRRRAAAAR